MRIDSSVLVPRSESVRDLLARRTDIELSFVQHRRSKIVHVIVPTDPDIGYESTPSEEINWIGWLVGDCYTLCGYVARVYLDGMGHGDQRISCFDDELLCGSCHRILGPLSSRAFEHPLPARDNEAVDTDDIGGE